MVEFRQKTFTEYDAMKLLYNHLKRDGYWREKVKVIDRSSVIPILRGKNILIERFVISSNFFGRDKYRIYIKIGAQAKLPDEVRLPEIINQKKLLNARLEIKSLGGKIYQNNYSEFIEDLQLRDKLFNEGGNGNQNRQNQNNNNNNNGEVPTFKPNVKVLDPGFDIMYEIRSVLANAIKYDKRDRSLVLEFDGGPSDVVLRNVVSTLGILPFGLEYNIYLLDA